MIEPLLQTVLPSGVKAIQTTRTGGFSQAPYDGFNLGLHVGDNPLSVEQNRTQLLPQMPGCQQLHWLEQVHSTQVHLIQSPEYQLLQADAAVTRISGQGAVIMTADCLPVLFWNQDGSEIGAAHAGWRGLVDGILENTLKQLHSPTHKVSAWLGPCIGPDAFEVGEEVRQAFIKHHAQAEAAFKPSQTGGKWLASLHQLARERLQNAGIETIYSDQRCTYNERKSFYSYRREGVTGRMASAIWILD